MRKVIALGFALVAGLWLATPAAAAAATLHVSPDSVSAGGSVQVSGTCEPNTSGFALSHAFLHDPSHDFAGVGAVAFHTDAAGAFSVAAQVPTSIPAGSYQVSARCGGGNLGISVTLTVTAAAQAPPTAVPAGSGGQAATSSSGAERTQLAVAAAGLALLLAGGLGSRRLLRPSLPRGR